ncbi:penicillin-binding protein 2 [Oceanomicrobium pacificus]|uniref:Penicillin-binding protein 2 n=1 Tax=Oceanomicrobium pacificus TaxID=2692916 RepID=A0A6B0TPR0_9RHOB|nr:penicillin-binding protein 2 [Oceanomicrobium pacificus]MXU64649.1 penicillin-binding protein 2 [Oceanomicrobium pacificus]
MKKKTGPAAPSVTRRGLVLLGAQLGMVGLLGWRMRQLQVEEAEKYRLLAEENRISIRLIPPERGLITDRNGILIADNRQNLRVVMVREQARDPELVLDRLAQLIPMDADDREKALKEMYRRSAFVPVTVAEQLEWEHFSRVAANAPALPGVTPEVGLSRHYPMGGDYAHVAGYVGPVSDWDLQQLDDPDPLLQIPKFQIGKTGLEKDQEAALRGQAGTKKIEVNSAGRVMRELERNAGTPGANTALTVDHDLQHYAMKRLKGESAATVVMDVRNGDILCMAAAPSFDPNDFVLGISSKNWKALLEDEYRPLANKPVSGGYPPGSTFKMVVAMAALEAGVVGIGDTVYCPGHYQLGNRRFHCWRRGGHGHVALKDSLKKSCDVYYYDIARRVGIDKIAEMANRLGLGVKHDLPLPAVSRGLVPTQGWKRANRDEGWLIGDTLNSGIGQGFVLASPLQLAVMAARIGSGTDVAPRIIRSVDGQSVPAPEPKPLDLAPGVLSAVRNGMFAVSNEQGGTAYGSRIAEKAMMMSGKTGTSQVRNITADERRRGVTRNEDLPWNRRDHALFVAYAPSDNPRYAISVVVEHGGGGSKAAAPIARDVMLRTLYGGEVPLEAYPAGQRDKIRQMHEDMDAAPSVSQSDPETLPDNPDRA